MNKLWGIQSVWGNDETVFESLKSFNLLKNNRIETGVFRAKYIKTQNECFEPNWITWINPNTETPNFHIASSFGVFILKE